MDITTSKKILPSSHTAIIGGTFDTLHLGHKEYIKTAFEFSENVIIFLRTNEYAQKYKSYCVKSYQERAKQVKNFIEEICCKDRYIMKPLNSENTIIKFCLTNDNISIAVLEPKYYSLFERINKERKNNGLKRLLFIVKPRTCGSDGNDINSTNINGKNINMGFNPRCTMSHYL